MIDSSSVALPHAHRVWRWRVFAATWLCYAGFYFCRKPYSIVKSDLGKALSFSPQDLAFAYSGFLIAYTVGQFSTGVLGPKLGARRMLLGAMIISLFTSLGMGAATSLPAFIALMTINGLVQGVGWANCVSNMTAWFHARERGTVMGFWATNFQFGGVAANGMAAWLLAHYGFQYAFIGGALVLALVSVFFFFNQANSPTDKGFSAFDAPAVAANTSEISHVQKTSEMSRSAWLTVVFIGLAYFGLKFIRYALWSWAPFVLSRNFHLKGDDAGYVSTLFDLGGMAGVIFLGWASDKLFKGRHALASFCMLLGLVAATAVMATWGQNNVTVFAVSMMFTGFALYGPDAILTTAAVMNIAERSTVKASGVIGGLGAVGSVVQEVLIGKSGADLSAMLPMLFISAVTTALCLAAVLLQRRFFHHGAAQTGVSSSEASAAR